MARRITPIAVDQPVAAQGNFATNGLGAAEGPLDVGPAPDQGDVKSVHPKLGAGRRVHVDIQASGELKFKQVLRQQGVDIMTYKQEQDERYKAHFKSLFGDDPSTKNKKEMFSLANLEWRAVHETLQATRDSEDGANSDSAEDDSDEEGDGDEDEGGDGSSDDAEEGAGGDGEIDLGEADKKPKRQRFERYEDDFIDDSEIEMVKGGPKVKTRFTGFYINKGNLEVIEEGPTKQRRRAPKPPADPAAAAAAAAGSGPPAKRRKQQEPPVAAKQQKLQEPSQQQQQQQQQDAEEPTKKRKKAKQGDSSGGAEQQQQQQQVAAGEGAELEAGAKKKRARSENAGPAAAAAAAADGAADAPASKKARKASPAPPEAAAPPPPAVPAAGGGIANLAIAAAKAAAARKAASGGAAARGSSAAVALPPAGPTAAAKKDTAAAGGAAASEAAQASQQQQQQHQAQSPLQAAMSAVFPAAAPPDAPAAAPAAAAAASGGAAEQGVVAPAGLPDEVVEAAQALQTAVEEHQEALSAPSATTATRNKLLAAPLSSLGLAFARLAEPQQQQLQAQLLQLVGPQLPHLNDKQLRKKLLQEPKDKLAAMQDSRDRLMEALPAVRGAAAGGAGAGAEGAASDDDFQAHWSAAAEDALVAAWNAAKAVAGQQGVSQLALDVCTALGNTAVQEQPDKAVSEVQQVYNRAKRRQKAAKDEAKAAAADPHSQAEGADGTSTVAAASAAQAAAAPQSQAAQGARVPSRPLSPVPSGAVTAPAAPAAAAAAAGPVSTPGKGRGSQQDSDTATDDEGAEPGGKEAAGAAGAEDGTQGSKMEFSQWQAPSPRLVGCLEAAKAAGASEDWLRERYSSIRKTSTHGHQAFRVLCYAGPAGCRVRDFRALGDQHNLGFHLEATGKGTQNMKQALAGKGLSNIVGITEADHMKCALLAFPGVIPRPIKTSRAPTPGGQAEGGGEGAGASGAAAAE